MAKQRYILDFDDILQVAFLTKANATALLDGLNMSATDSMLAIQVGGTGNSTFAKGQTLVFDGEKITSSGAGPIAPASGPLVNDNRYYTKTEIDEFFASLNAPAGFPVAYANITGAPPAGQRFWFLNTPITVYSGSSVMSNPVEYHVTAEVLGQKIVAALVTCTCGLSGPNSGGPAKLVVQANLSAPQIDVGWFQAAGGADVIAGCNGQTVPVDANAQSFFYQQINNSVTGSDPIVLKLVGYIYS